MQSAARAANGQRRPAGRNLNSVLSRKVGGGGGDEVVEEVRFIGYEHTCLQARGQGKGRCWTKGFFALRQEPCKRKTARRIAVPSHC